MNYYVYEHWRLDKDECFYVGKGISGRAYERSHRNVHWKNIVAKLERNGFAYEVRFVATGLSEEDAFALEKERIAFWRDIVDLTNQTDGGEGCSGRVFSAETILKLRSKKNSEETLNKMSAYQSSRTEEHKQKLIKANTGKKRSAEARRRMSEAHIGKKYREYSPLSQETKDKISNANIGRIPWNKGMPMSEESRAKMRASKIGNKNRLGGNKYLSNQIPQAGDRQEAGQIASERKMEK